MPIYLDPEEAETQALLDSIGDLAGKRVLEIGAGDGRMTWRYARRAVHVTAIDPNADEITCALKDLPTDLQGKVVFRPVSIEDFELAGSPAFDVAILAWAL